MTPKGGPTGPSNTVQYFCGLWWRNANHGGLRMQLITLTDWDTGNPVIVNLDRVAIMTPHTEQGRTGMHIVIAGTEVPVFVREQISDIQSKMASGSIPAFWIHQA